MQSRSGWASFCFVSLVGLSAVSWAGEGVVLAIRPEGVVVKVGPLGELQPGAKVGFLEPGGERRESGQGWVLEVREGRALVGLRPGSVVRPGGGVIVCPAPGQDPYQELRGLVGQLREQAGRPGTPGGASLQALTSQVQITLEARDATVQGGACETADYDRQLLALAADLQTLAGRLQPPAGVAAPPAAPVPGAPSSTEPPPPSAGKSPLEGMAEVLAKVSEIIQAVKGTPAAALPAGGMESGGTGAFPTTPGTDPGVPAVPLPGGGPESASPGPVPPGPGPTPGAPTGIGGGVPAPLPGPASPAPVTTVRGKIRGERGQPLGGATVSAVEWNQTLATAPDGSYYFQGPGGPLTLTAKATGYQDGSLVTMVAPGVTTTRSLFLRKEAKAETGKEAEKDKGKAWTIPGKVAPGVDPIAKVPPGALKPASVVGKVLNEKGRPVPGARVAVEGAGSILTNSQGRFSIRNVKPGQHQVTVTASGFRAETRTLTLEGGEAESLNFTLKPLIPPYKPAFPKREIIPRP